MYGMKDWPSPLLRQWFLTCVIGCGCLLVGAAVFLRTGDRTMLMISILLSLASAIRCILLHRIFSKQAYSVTEGMCTLSSRRPAYRCMELLDDTGKVFSFNMDRRQRVCPGACYRVYYHLPGGSRHPQVLALEELASPDPEAEEKNPAACRN